MRISDWSSDVCSSDLMTGVDEAHLVAVFRVRCELAVGYLQTGRQPWRDHLCTGAIAPQHATVAVVVVDGAGAVFGLHHQHEVGQAFGADRKSTRLNSSYSCASSMPSSA